MRQSGSKDKHERIIISSTASIAEWIGLISDFVILVVLAVDQLCYQMNMLFLIIPVSLVGIYLLMNCVYPEEYHFTEENLEIWQFKKRKNTISYDSVFNMESEEKDKTNRIGKSYVIKLYYEDNSRKRLSVCRPIDSYYFKETVLSKCQVFHEDEEESKLNRILIDKQE